MADWYVKIKGKQGGPLSARQLKTLANRGQISPDDLVRQESGGVWVPAGRVKGLFSAGAAASAQAETARTPAAERPEEPDGASASPAGSGTASPPAAATEPESPPAPETVASRPEGSPVATGPPRLPAAPEGQPAAVSSLGDFRVVGDSPTDRVLGRGASSRAARWNTKAAVSASAVLMLIAVSAVGAILIRSTGDSGTPSPARPEAAAAEPAAPAPSARAQATPAAEGPSAAAAAPESSEPNAWQRGIDGLGGLETLGLGSSPTSQSEAAGGQKGPKAVKPAPATATARAKPSHRPGGGPTQGRQKPPGEGRAKSGKTAKTEQDPDGDVSKITADIEALGGGDGSGRAGAGKEYDLEKTLKKDQEKTQVKKGSLQRKGRAKGGRSQKGSAARRNQGSPQRQNAKQRPAGK